MIDLKVCRYLPSSSPFFYSLTETQIQTNSKVGFSVMIISKFVYLRQKCDISYDAPPTEPDIQLRRDKVDSINSYQFEAMIPFGTSNPKQEIPDDLRVAYKEFRRLYEALGCYHIHCYARELYEKSYAAGHFRHWPQKIVIAGCLFTAFSATRSILYARQRTTLAPKTKKEEEIFGTLQQFFATPVSHTNRSRMDQVADVSDLSTSLLSAYNKIQAFCDSFCLPSSVASYAKFLFAFAYERADYDTHEIDALIVSCFYIACRQMKMHESYVVVQSLTNVPTSEIEATVTDLEDYFSAQHAVEKREQDKAGNIPWGPGYVSAFDVTNSLKDLEYQDPGRVRIVYTMFTREVRIPFHMAHAQIPPDHIDGTAKNVLTFNEKIGNRSIPLKMVHRCVEKKDQKTGTGPIAVHGDHVTIQFRRKLRNGTPLDRNSSGHQITFTIGDNCMDIDALHMGVKGMSVGGSSMFPSMFRLFSQRVGGMFRRVGY